MSSETRLRQDCAEALARRCGLTAVASPHAPVHDVTYGGLSVGMIHVVQDTASRARHVLFAPVADDRVLAAAPGERSRSIVLAALHGDGRIETFDTARVEWVVLAQLALVDEWTARRAAQVHTALAPHPMGSELTTWGSVNGHLLSCAHSARHGTWIVGALDEPELHAAWVNVRAAQHLPGTPPPFAVLGQTYPGPREALAALRALMTEAAR